MKKGLSLEDIPGGGVSNSWAATLVEEFLESGDQVWELTSEDIPPEVKQPRVPLATTMKRKNGAGRVMQRGESFFLVRGDDR